MFHSGQTPYHQAKILIVDDQQDNLELLSTICTLHGFEVVTSSGGESAIELAAKISPHLILLDISMPEMDGFTVCQILKNNDTTKDIPIIFITAIKRVEDKINAFELGGNDYITKPFQVEDVIARVENQLKLHIKLNTVNEELAKETQERQAAEAKLLKLNQKLTKLTALDSLTNIANRSYFDDIFAREWKRGEKENTTLSLILCTIDRFKPDSDRHNDIYLKQVAKSLLETVNRSGDLVGRYGEQEFAVILPQTKAEDAITIAEKIVRQTKKLDIPHSDSLINNSVSLSLGITSIVPNRNYNKEQLLSTAREALNEAKTQGGNRAVFKLTI